MGDCFASQQQVDEALTTLSNTQTTVCSKRLHWDGDDSTTAVNTGILQ